MDWTNTKKDAQGVNLLAGRNALAGNQPFSPPISQNLVDALRPSASLPRNNLLPQELQQPRKVYGYEVRNPYDSEDNFFRQNPHVSGMAAEDGKITLNPHSPLKPHEQDAVARNEAARLYMRDQKFNFDFDPTPEQQRSFDGTAYASDPYNMRATLLARILSGDPSAGQATPRQREWADWLKQRLEER